MWPILISERRSLTLCVFCDENTIRITEMACETLREVVKILFRKHWNEQSGIKTYQSDD